VLSWLIPLMTSERTALAAFVAGFQPVPDARAIRGPKVPFLLGHMGGGMAA